MTGGNFLYDAIEANMGSMYIGVMLSAVLLGLCLTQTFYYYLNYPKDPWYYRWLVGITAFLDTVHLALVAHSMYHYLILNFDNPEGLKRLVWSIVIEALFTGVTGALVQCFYLTRVWRMSKSFLLTGFIMFFVLADVGCGTVWVIIAIQIKTYNDFMRINPLTITINAASTAADILIAASLCILLHRARTGFKKSDTVITKLIIFVVNTGVLTSICALAALIALVVSPNTLVYASFYFCIGRLYTNALLATLNARKIVSGSNNDTSHMMVSMPSTLLNSVNGPGSKGQKGSQSISIRIDTTTTQGFPEGLLASNEPLQEKIAPTDEEYGAPESENQEGRHRDSKDKGSFAV